VDVYLNGVKLAAADYTATNGSDIVLTTGAALDDILEYVAYTPFEVADQTFTGTTTTDVLTTTGRLTLPTNTYHYSSDGKARLYYYDNGDTMLRTADDFQFRNNTNTTVAQLSGTGSLTVTGNIAATGDISADNLNLNTYSSGAASDRVALGVAVNGSVCFFLLPISGFTPPTGITVTGTFKITSVSGTTVTGGSGVTPADGGGSSNKMQHIMVTGLAVTAGNSYYLRATDATSVIEVNY
jgi:hypothetical protein